MSSSSTVQYYSIIIYLVYEVERSIETKMRTTENKMWIGRIGVDRLNNGNAEDVVKSSSSRRSSRSSSIQRRNKNRRQRTMSPSSTTSTTTVMTNPWKTWIMLVLLVVVGIAYSAPVVSFVTPLASKHHSSYARTVAYAFTDGTDRMTSSSSSSNKHVKKDGTNNSSWNKLPEVLENGGRVTLVGAGPGDPDLLTMAAYRVVTDPKACIIVDRLVSEEILALIPNGNYKVARKYPGCANIAQEEIYTWVKEALEAGQHVVRLKIGDPFVFGRGGEEVLKFRSFGVEPKIIPGVSAAFSAPLLGSIPVTHRGVSNQVVMCTGYGRDNTSPDLIQYHKEQTIVFLMAVGRLKELSQNLITKANYPPLTPVAIVEKAGCPSQRTLVGNLETIASLAEQHHIIPPSTIVVGDVVHVLLTDPNPTNEEQVKPLLSGLISNMTTTTTI